MPKLDEILAEEEQKPQPPASTEEKKSAEDQIQKEKQELENIKKAKQEALSEVKKLREEKSKIKKDKEEIPKIDFDDPGSKAWDKHIKEQVTPLQKEIEQEKQERFDYALDEVLDELPDLADKEKLKETMGVYNALPQARTIEGIKTNLKRAFAAVDPEGLVSRMREKRGEKVRSDMAFSQAAISRGVSSMQTDKELSPSDNLSKEEKEAAIRMYGSLEEYNKAAEGTK
jgi:hypothetical protein